MAVNAFLPPDQAWSVSAVLHLVFAALGMYVFLVRRLDSAAGAAVAAFAHVFSEFMIGRAAGGHLNLV